MPLPAPFRHTGISYNIHIWDGHGGYWYVTFLSSQGAVPPKLKLRRDRYETVEEVRDRAVEAFRQSTE